jgi:excisionase family DNA binding protein
VKEEFPPPVILEPLVGKEELARRLGITQSCISKWRRQRRIPAYKFGRRCVRFDYPEVVRILAAYKIPAWEKFKRRRPARPRPVFNAPVHQIQAELRFEDPRQLLLFPEVPRHQEDGAAPAAETLP